MGKKRTALAIAIALSCTAWSYANIVYAAETEFSAEAVAIDDTEMSFELEELTVEAKRPDWESKLSPGTVTVVRPDDYKGEQKTLPDLLLMVPGVHVREVNGKGQYTTVTVRGSTAAQVGIFIDGVLANLGGDTAVDLSTIPIKNVERVEVYRGYIPSRFGGTFMGGVINIVTKKPDKPNMSLELGKSSYGGKKGSFEMTTPAGDGSLMVGINYESSDGDFKYKNYAAERYIPILERDINGLQSNIDNFNDNNIDLLTSGSAPLINLTNDQIDYYKNNESAWVDFVRGEGDESLSGAIYENRYNYAQSSATDVSKFEQQLVDMGIKDEYLAYGYSESGRNSWLDAAQNDWNGSAMGDGIITPEVKDTIIKDYADSTYQSNVNEWQTKADPDKSETLSADKKQLADKDKKLKESQNADRYRKYNDYENSNAIVKWQNENWIVKGTYNKIDRHLPDGLWGGSDANAAVENSNTDLYDTYYYDSRRQKQESTGFMVQNRHTTGKLEWGWMLDYLHQDKQYRAEHIMPEYINQWEAENTPLREWSKYVSNKYNAQIDGSYQISENSMLDFQVNYSTERMNIDGSNMDKILSDQHQNTPLGQIRNRYDQDILNIQIQNSITLDEKGTWIFTPGLRYNQSTITGYSDGKRFGDGHYNWISPKDKQTDGKATWQLALKKEFNENFSMRMTGGTYYRLLNMSEIAGDGAGILPAPADYTGGDACFPLPEEGKQFDISAIVNTKLLGADNATTLTYFWRKSENMLQLVRAGRDYWCYFNDNRGEVDGVELQSNFNWSKFDLDFQVTYMNPFAERKNSVTGYGYSEVWSTYQPEWEGNIRLTYRPSEKFSLFTEAHYTDEYFTSYAKSSEGGEKAYLSGKPVADLLVINGGIKWMPREDCQITFGCNDIFNEGPKLKIRSNSAYVIPGYINPEFPIQGRTYYLTARFSF